jgi:hypothetical protein
MYVRSQNSFTSMTALHGGEDVLASGRRPSEKKTPPLNKPSAAKHYVPQEMKGPSKRKKTEEIQTMEISSSDGEEANDALETEDGNQHPLTASVRKSPRSSSSLHSSNSLTTNTGRSSSSTKFTSLTG